jgi:DNA-binding Xre family transcriptional regulator
MLYYNLQRIFTLRGIDRPFSYLVQNGFAVTTATRIINGNVGGLNLLFVDKLCVLLKCTPNDLLGWKPSKNGALSEGHPLQGMQASKRVLVQ